MQLYCVKLCPPGKFLQENIVKAITILAFLLLAAETRANALSSRLYGGHLSLNDAHNLNIALQRAARKGKSRKIIKLMQRASRYGVVIHHHDFEVMLQNVAASGKPKAINLVVELADKRWHTYYFSNTFGHMFHNAALSGSLQAINLVVELADVRDIRVRADDFIQAMARVAEKADTETIADVLDIATSRGFQLGTSDISDAVIDEMLHSAAAKSGDTETIVMVTELMDKHNIEIADKHFGEALVRAARGSYKDTRQVLELLSSRDVNIDREYLVTALENTGSSISHFGVEKKMQLLLEFAAQQGITLNADDFGGVMASAARHYSWPGIEIAIKVATEHGLTINRQHFVATMQAIVGAGFHFGLNGVMRFAGEHNIQFHADDFVALMIKAIDDFHLNTIPYIDKLAIKHRVNLEKKHFSQLLAQAVERKARSLNLKEINSEVVETVIELGNSYGLVMDAEFFDTTVGYLNKDSTTYTLAIKIMKDIARDYGVKLAAAQDL